MAPSPSTAAQRRAHRRLTREDNRYHSGTVSTLSYGLFPLPDSDSDSDSDSKPYGFMYCAEHVFTDLDSDLDPFPKWALYPF